MSPATFASAVAAVALLGSVAACNGALDPPGKKMPTKEALLQEGSPAVDLAALERANAGLQRLADAEQPVMTLPSATGAGVVGRLDLARAAVQAGRSRPATLTDPTGSNLQTVEIEFENASLQAVIEFLFDEYLQEPYTILPDFEDKSVNLVISGRFERQDVIGIFETFLASHGVSMRRRDGLYTISSAPQRASLDPVGESDTTSVWRLDFVQAAEIVPILREFVSEPQGIKVLDSINTVFAVANASEIAEVDEFIEEVDISHLADRRILLYEPRYLTPRALVALLQNLPQKLGLPDAQTRIVEADVVEDRNLVVIVAPAGEMETAVRRFLSEVDQPGENVRQVFYYPLRNQEAQNVAATVRSVVDALFVDATDISIVPYEATNSLIITARPEQFFEVRKLFERLDFTVPAVLIDATIVEVLLNDTLAYGVEWFLSKQFGNTAVADWTTDLINTAAPGADAVLPGSGTTIGIVSLASNKFAALDLLGTETDLRVVARPRVLVKNNFPAFIKTTDEIRIAASIESSDITTGGTTGFIRNFETKEVGIILEVTPQINDDGTIDLQIKIEDSRQGPTDLSTGEPQPTFNVREVTSNVAVANGQTIVIGGLFRQLEQKERQKVPLLGDIPIVGYAFANETDRTQKTELIVLVTPYIVLDRKAARIVSDAITGAATGALGHSYSGSE